MKQAFLAFACLALATTPSIIAQSPACAPSNGLNFICGFQKPEDLEVCQARSDLQLHGAPAVNGVARMLKETTPCVASVSRLSATRSRQRGVAACISSVASSIAIAPPRGSGPKIAARRTYCSSDVIRAVDSQTSTSSPLDATRAFTALQARDIARLYSRPEIQPSRIPRASA